MDMGVVQVAAAHVKMGDLDLRGASLMRVVALLGLCLPGMAAVACGQPYEAFPLDQVCRDAGYAIAARTLDCEGDTSLAQQRYDRFNRDYRCGVTSLERDPVDVYYHCTSQISGASCEQIRSFGDDLGKYLSLSPTCAQFLQGPGLSQGAAGAGGEAGAAGTAGAGGEAGAGGDSGAAGASGSGEVTP